VNRARDGVGIGVQLYTLRSLELPLDDLLAGVAARGAEGVETVALQGADAAPLREALERHGLLFASAHVPIAQLREAPAHVAATYRAAGAPLLVVPYLAPADRPTSRSDWERFAAELDAIAEIVRDEGLELAYHHHEFELAEVEGVVPLEVLLERSSVGVELDAAWCAASGVDAAALIDRAGARCIRLHAKDVTLASGRVWADVGDGIVDGTAVREAARRAGTAWWLVEHDTPSDPWRSVERGVTALRALLAD
jgi:sugar phosphate isomerase/epimerase